MLRFADELLLLLIDEKRGDLIPIPEWSLACALAGALLMDLALEGRIDTDPDHLSLLDARPLDDDLLDPVLADIAQAETAQHARFWVAHFAAPPEEIRDKTLTRLTAQGILEADEGGFFSFLPSVSRTRRYPADQAVREDVQLRVMRVLFSSDIPDPRDIAIIGLAEACGGFERLLSPAEREVTRERIALLGRMDLIGRAVTEVIQSGDRDVAVPSPPRRPVPKAQPPVISVLLGTPFIRREYLPRPHLRDREERPDAGARDLLHHQTAGQAGHAVRPQAHRHGRPGGQPVLSEERQGLLSQPRILDDVRRAV